jgi:hypothetical protein
MELWDHGRTKYLNGSPLGKTLQVGGLGDPRENKLGFETFEGLAQIGPTILI